MLNLKKLLTQLVNRQKITRQVITASGSYMVDAWTVQRCGKIAILNINTVHALPQGSAVTVATLPYEYRPVSNGSAYQVLSGAGNGSLSVLISVLTNGSVQMHNYSNITGGINCRANITYICNGDD